MSEPRVEVVSEKPLEEKPKQESEDKTMEYYNNMFRRFRNLFYDYFTSPIPYDEFMKYGEKVAEDSKESFTKIAKDTFKEFGGDKITPEQYIVAGVFVKMVNDFFAVLDKAIAYGCCVDTIDCILDVYIRTEKILQKNINDHTIQLLKSIDNIIMEYAFIGDLLRAHKSILEKEDVSNEFKKVIDSIVLSFVEQLLNRLEQYTHRPANMEEYTNLRYYFIQATQEYNNLSEEEKAKLKEQQQVPPKQ